MKTFVLESRKIKSIEWGWYWNGFKLKARVTSLYDYFDINWREENRHSGKIMILDITEELGKEILDKFEYSGFKKFFNN